MAFVPTASHTFAHKLVHSGYIMSQNSIRTHRLYVYRVKTKSKSSYRKEGKAVPSDYFVEKFIKIGMTSQDKIVERFTKFPDAFVERYSFSLMTSQKFETRKRLFDVEQELHKNLAKYRYTPKVRFSGYTECYISTPDSIKAIKEAVWEIRKKYAPNCAVLKQKTAHARMKASHAKKKGPSPSRQRRTALRASARLKD